jgi:hexosaminidase
MKRIAAALTVFAAISACRSTAATHPTGPTARPTPVLMQPLASLDVHRIVPMPSSVSASGGAPFPLTATTAIAVPGGNADLARVGEALAAMMRPATGMPFPVSPITGAAPAGTIVLRLGGSSTLGTEGYELTINVDSVLIVGAAPAGVFYGVQTFRQLLPAAIESEQSVHRSAAAWSVPAGRITDSPRFAWRGAMLDVARHFFTVDEVKQLIDILALYKLNTLHLHLADDQGWRIQIDSWPRLAQYGGSTEVGGGAGGYFTKADYGEIVRYAQDRFITIVPEIDMPAHSNAAIASYPELGCSRAVPDAAPNVPSAGLYTGIHVGWSALCHDKDVSYKFVHDVLGELAAMTPGPFLHVGGDEVEVLTVDQYAAFVDRVQDIVAQTGKRMIGWDEIGRAHLKPGTVAQMWRSDTTNKAVKQGAKLVMSPATFAYLDMKYTPATELGLDWAAFIELRTAYDWDPVTAYKGITASDVIGVEAPLWSETVQNITAAEYLLMPRLPAIAEVAWSQASTHDWESFRTRIAAHAARWRLLGVNYYASPQVAW